jgi:hypothetical protein
LAPVALAFSVAPLITGYRAHRRFGWVSLPAARIIRSR